LPSISTSADPSVTVGPPARAPAAGSATTAAFGDAPGLPDADTRAAPVPGAAHADAIASVLAAMAATRYFRPILRFMRCSP